MLVMVIMMMMATTMMIMICAPLSAVTYNSLVQHMPLKYSHLHYLPVLKYQFGVGGRDVRLNIIS